MRNKTRQGSKQNYVEHECVYLGRIAFYNKFSKKNIQDFSSKNIHAFSKSRNKIDKSELIMKYIYLLIKHIDKEIAVSGNT